MFYTFLVGYLIAINLVGIFICIKDKYASIKGKWRIKESTLIILCILGASIGIYFCMKLIRHKTKHLKFMLGIPLIIVIQLILSAVLILHI